MAAYAQNVMPAEQRDAEREDVFYRTRCTTADGSVEPAQVVNISASGFMARSEGDFAEGDRITIRLPVVGAVAAEVRWALGGRIGCRFEEMIGLAPYLSLLSELVAQTR